jgi:hypothetical protein
MNNYINKFGKNVINIMVFMLHLTILSYSQIGYAKFDTKTIYTSCGISYISSFQDQKKHSEFKQECHGYSQVFLSEDINEKEVDEIIDYLKKCKEQGIDIHLYFDNFNFLENAKAKMIEEIRNNHIKIERYLGNSFTYKLWLELTKNNEKSSDL